MNWLLKTKNTKLVAICWELGGVWLVQVAETDWLTCVPPLGIRLTCLPRVVQPLPPHLARHDFNPFWGSFTWFLGGYPLVFSLASWREKKLMVASLAWLGLDEKGAWVPPGYNKCYLIRNCLPFHMLFLTCEPSHANPHMQILRHCLAKFIWNGLWSIQVFTTYERTNDSSC